jgi:hypothetical protein
VADELRAELEAVLADYEALVGGPLVEFNRALAERGLAGVGTGG